MQYEGGGQADFARDPVRIIPSQEPSEPPAKINHISHLRRRRPTLGRGGVIVGSGYLIGKISISTRRFLARPDFVLLEAIGFVSPKPSTDKRSAPIPWAAK